MYFYQYIFLHKKSEKKWTSLFYFFFYNKWKYLIFDRRYKLSVIDDLENSIDIVDLVWKYTK